MTIFIASDHAGFKLKHKIVEYLKELDFDVVDKGAHTYDETDDYPDYISLVAEEISKNSEHKGIILGGSGQGEAMVANRFSHVRAAVYYGGSENIIKLSREHNDANILSLGARFLDDKTAFVAILEWLKTPFLNAERHKRRIQKIDAYPKV